MRVVGVFFFPFTSCEVDVIPERQQQAEQDAQGEAHGDPVILDGGDRADMDGLPHSRMLEQVSWIPIPFTLCLYDCAPALSQLQTLLDSPLDRTPI